MIIIRKASIKDLEGILVLSQKLFEYETRFNREFNQEWTYSESGKEYFKIRIEGDKSIALVAEESGEIVGYAISYMQNFAFRKKNPLAELENMFVEEGFRGKGVGTMLVEEIKKQLKKRNVLRLKVEAFYPNTQAINFYKKLGFSNFASVLEMDL
jgi:ribosomal protein S18 acetylase RimI-like enzyme